jgi:mono/diheme cytochrome c family protein
MGDAGPVGVVIKALVGALALVVASCGPGDAENEIRGKQLFVQRCGSCHELDRAGTAGTQGPDLDAAFRRARADGIPASTIAGIVEGQILHPGRDSAMPAGLVEGERAEDVAAYVARSAAVPGRDTGRLADAAIPADAPPGLRVFAQSGCGGCHVLADAGAAGTTGPDLDAALEGRDAPFIREAIVAPDSEVAQGYSAGVMPGDYDDRLTAEDLDALVEYLAEVDG